MDNIDWVDKSKWIEKRKNLAKEIVNTIDSNANVMLIDIYNLIKILGGMYGRDNVRTAIKNAGLSEVEKAFEYLDRKGLVRAAREKKREEPDLKFCPHCGKKLYDIWSVKI